VTELIIRILIVLILVGAVLVYRKTRQDAKRQELINNPPQRACIEVCLPYGVNNSNKRMQEFYARVRSQAESDSALRKKGLGNIQILYLAENRYEGDEVQIRWFLYCDPDRMETVKRFLRRTFDNSLATISIPKEDPMAKYSEKLKPAVKEEENARE
jgi:hypothetical protein